MHETTGHILTVFMGFFAIMNPIANTPVFPGLAASDSTAIRRRIEYSRHATGNADSWRPWNDCGRHERLVNCLEMRA